MERITRIEKANNKTQTIAFRVDGQAFSALNGRAKLFGMSTGELGRAYVLEALLANEEREQLRQAVTLLQSEIKELRTAFAHAVQVLLVSAGKVEAQQAEKWVKETFDL